MIDNKLDYLNIGCGNKFHKDWFNIDLKGDGQHVIQHDLLTGIPFADNMFSVIYHSQLLEHISKKQAVILTKECHRVLKPGGVLRVVVPDLEDIACEYLKILHENINKPSQLAEAKYDWILLELLDQFVRHRNGGLMMEYLQQPDLVNWDYVIERIGEQARRIGQKRSARDGRGGKSRARRNPIRKIISKIRNSVTFSRTPVESEEERVGKFRLSGEVHMWMYDRFSLGRLLRNVGFEGVKVMGPEKSQIVDWDKYQLDMTNDKAIDPKSLFMEANKPR